MTKHMATALLPQQSYPALTWAFDYHCGDDTVFVRWLDVNDTVRRAHLAVLVEDGDLVLAQGQLDDTTFEELLDDVAEYYSERGATRFRIEHAAGVSL